MKQGDQDWRGGRVFSLVYSAGDDVHELLSDALALYSAENGLNVLAFPSIGTMQHDIVRNTATLLGADDPAAGRGGGGLSHLRWHREPAAGREDRTRRRARAGHRPTRRRGGRERTCRLHQSGRLLRRRSGPRAGRERLPRQRRRAGGRVLREHDHGGGVCADLSPRGDRPHRRHRVDGPRPGHPVPRRRVHGRVPPPVPRPSWGGWRTRSTSASRASPPCRPTCTSTATPRRGCR